MRIENKQFQSPRNDKDKIAAPRDNACAFGSLTLQCDGQTTPVTDITSLDIGQTKSITRLEAGFLMPLHEPGRDCLLQGARQRFQCGAGRSTSKAALFSYHAALTNLHARSSPPRPTGSTAICMRPQRHGPPARGSSSHLCTRADAYVSAALRQISMTRVEVALDPGQKCRQRGALSRPASRGQWRGVIPAREGPA